MYKTWHTFFFIIVCVVSAGCVPHSTNVGVSQFADPDVIESQDNHYEKEQDQRCEMTYKAIFKVLLLEQDYQGALDMMPQVAQEMLEEELLEKETFEKGMLERDPAGYALRTSIVTYCFLYTIMGRDEDALQKIMEIGFPITADPLRIFMDSRIKIHVMERLNMIDDIIDELNTILNDPNIGPALLREAPVFHAEAMETLIIAQIAQGDFESARNNISDLRNLLLRWPTHISEILQVHSTLSENLSLAEYYINHLVETHVVHFVKGEVEPPVRNPDEPDEIVIGMPDNGFAIVSKTDGNLFTLYDLRKILAASIPDPFPVLQNNDEQTSIE